MNFTSEKSVESGRYRITSDQSFSFLEFFRSLVEDEAMRLQWNQTLASMPLEAVFWELPPLRKDRLDRSFECMVIDAPILVRPANSSAFSTKFSNQPSHVVRFWNLGHDALLVVPVTNPGCMQEFSHLATFCRNADTEIASAFWKLTSETVLEEISDLPVWVSTSGAGVPWLHLRIDSYPKYYVHDPYRSCD